MHFMIISVSCPPILFLVMIIQVLFGVLSSLWEWHPVLPFVIVFTTLNYNPFLSTCVLDYTCASLKCPDCNQNSKYIF